MTPERVKAIAEPVAEIADECCYRGDPWYSHVKSAIDRAITMAVNEALEEAAKVCTDYGAMYCHNAIRAIKLPEQP